MAYKNESNENEYGEYYQDQLINGIGDLYKSRELCEEYEEQFGDETPGASTVNITYKDGKN